MKLVIIEWVDSSQPSSPWQQAEDFKPTNPVSVFSAGFIVHDEGDVIALAPNVRDFGEPACKISGVIEIPKTSVTSVTPLIQDNNVPEENVEPE